jgi:hypothetical protein
MASESTSAISALKTRITFSRGGPNATDGFQI